MTKSDSLQARSPGRGEGRDSISILPYKAQINMTKDKMFVAIPQGRLVIRAPERWERWERVPSQFEIWQPLLASQLK